MLKTKLTKELIEKVLEILEINNNTYDEKEALKKNKVILELYNIPNLNGKYAYSETEGKFYNVEVLKDLENDKFSKKYTNIDEIFRDLEC